MANNTHLVAAANTRRSRIWRFACVTLLIVLPLVACGGDDDDDDADSDAPTATTSSTSSGATSSSSGARTYTAEELEQYGQDLVAAIASGDPAQLAEVLAGQVPQERIDELAACKPDDLTVSNIQVSTSIQGTSMRIEGTVDVTQGGETETKVVLWITEVSQTNDGEYVLSAFPPGCPFIFQ